MCLPNKQFLLFRNFEFSFFCFVVFKNLLHVTTFWIEKKMASYKKTVMAIWNLRTFKNCKKRTISWCMRKTIITAYFNFKTLVLFGSFHLSPSGHSTLFLPNFITDFPYHFILKNNFPPVHSTLFFIKFSYWISLPFYPAKIMVSFVFIRYVFIELYL